MTAPTWLARLEGALSPLAAEAPPAERHAAVAVVLAPRAGEADALLIRRAERAGDPWSGHMALPGGGVDPGETPFQTAVRETREEIGLDLAACARCLGRLEDHQALSGGVRRPFGVSPYVFALRSEPAPLALDANEVAEALWVPLETLRSGRLDGEFYWSGPDIPSLLLPCWDYEGRRIWGLTHRILTTLFERLG